MCTAVPYDHDITNYMSETKITVQMDFINLCTTYASILSNFENIEEKIIFSFCVLMISIVTLITKNVTSSGYELVE